MVSCASPLVTPQSSTRYIPSGWFNIPLSVVNSDLLVVLIVVNGTFFNLVKSSVPNSSLCSNKYFAISCGIISFIFITTICCYCTCSTIINLTRSWNFYPLSILFEFNTQIIKLLPYHLGLSIIFDFYLEVLFQYRLVRSY